MDTNKNLPEVKETVSLSEFKQFMFDKIVPVKDLKDHKGMPLEKVLAYWRRKELLPFIGEGSWLEISFAQLIWIRILDSLREISFPVGKMKKICVYFFKDAYFNDLPKKNIEFNKQEIEKKIKAGTQTEEDEHLLKYLDGFLLDKNLLSALKFDVNYLTNLIISAIAQGKEAIIKIKFNGEVAEFLDNEFIGHNGVDTNRHQPHICLSLTYFLNEFIENDVLETLLMPQLLNDDEKKVLREMRRKNIKEIVIYNNDQPVRRIESSKTGVLTKKEAEDVKKILGLTNYERITIETMDEKSLSFKKTRKYI
ncbi:MAG: hypothetical protein WCO28_11570 [Bacteroidota bacterium]